MTTYNYRDASGNAKNWITRLRQNDDNFPDINPERMDASDVSVLAGYLRANDPALSDEDQAFSESVADEIEALDGDDAPDDEDDDEDDD